MIELHPDRIRCHAGMIGFRPLYRQVRDSIVRRIADGLDSRPVAAQRTRTGRRSGRKPGHRAQGPRRDDGRKPRRPAPGKGHVRRQHDDARILFQFFRLSPDKGERQVPKSKLVGIGTQLDPEAAKHLQIPSGEWILVIERLRLLSGAVHVSERISVQASLFAGLESHDIPNNLYELYSRSYGVTVCRGNERLKAVAASEGEARSLASLRAFPCSRWIGWPIPSMDAGSNGASRDAERTASTTRRSCVSARAFASRDEPKAGTFLPFPAVGPMVLA